MRTIHSVETVQSLHCKVTKKYCCHFEGQETFGMWTKYPKPF